MKGKTYLVTGGTGFIGSALTIALVREGANVRVLDNQSRGASRRLAEIEGQYEFVEADVRDAESVARAVKGVDSVCHLAFVNGTEFFYTKPDLVLSVGVKGMVNVLDACLKHSIGELVLASSSEVYQSPPVVPTDETAPLSIPDVLNPRYSYAAGKIISEVMAVNFSKFFQRVLIFRPHNVYGGDMGWEHVIPQFAVRMKELLKSSPDSETLRFPIQGTGKETRAFIHIDDFTKGLLTMIEKGNHNEIYHIGTMEETTISKLAELVGRFYNRNIEVVPGKLLDGGTSRRCPDNTKMRALGFEPCIGIENGVAKTVRWYDENFNLMPGKNVELARK